MKSYQILQGSTSAANASINNNFDEIGQICIDLGSAQYDIAVKSKSQQILIDLQGNEVIEKIPSFACVILQEAINTEKLGPHQINFGNRKPETENSALMINWKNIFFESTAKIQYPDCPTIPSNSNRSARVWVSSLFEAFLYQALAAGVSKMIQSNAGINEFQTTLLIPSIGSDVHKEYLHKCFRTALEKLVQSNEIPQLNGKIISFQLKSEAAAGVQQALQKFPQLRNNNFLFADLGGFTSDFAMVKYKNGQYNVTHQAVNIAGNSIDILRRMLIVNQLADVQITNQFNLHEIIRQFKEENSSNQELKVQKRNVFCDQSQLCSFVLYTILAGLQKIHYFLTTAIQEDNMKILISYIYPFIKDNMKINILKENYASLAELEQLKQVSFQVGGKEILFPDMTQQEFIVWIFDNLKDETQSQVVQNFMQKQVELTQNSMFQKRKIEIKNQLKWLLDGKSDNIDQLFQIYIQYKYQAQVRKPILQVQIRKVCKEISGALPLFSTYKQLQEYINYKKISSSESQIKFYVSLTNYIEQSIQADLLQQFKTQFVETITDPQTKSYCNQSQSINITFKQFEEYMKQQNKTFKQLEQSMIQSSNRVSETQQQQLRQIEQKIKIYKDMYYNCTIISHILHVNNSNFQSMYESLCQVCGADSNQYSSIYELIIKAANINYLIKQRLAQEIFCCHNCKYVTQLISNLAFSKVIKFFLIKSIAIKDDITFKLDADNTKMSVSVVTDKIQEKMIEFAKDQNIQQIVMSGCFSKQSNFDNIGQQFNTANVNKLNPTDLANGGITNGENSNMLIHDQLQNGLQNDDVIDQFAFKFDNGIQIQKIRYDQFKCNRLNIDQGTSGTQASCAWVNDDYVAYVDTGGLLNEFDKKREPGTESVIPSKMPSFAIINISKLISFAKQFNEQYLTEDGNPNKDFEAILIEKQLTSTQLQETISFRSYNFNEFMEDSTKKKTDQQEQAPKKKLKTLQLKDVGKVPCQLDLLYSWKRLLYKIGNPVFPEDPVVESKYKFENDVKCIKIPLSLIYISQLLFIKQRYQELFDDPSKVGNTIALTMTVPCGANANHLHFIRCCCKQAGFGDNISFIYEPVSAFAHVFFTKLLSKAQPFNLNQDENVQQSDVTMPAGHYLVIDVGGGTTDLAYIEVTYDKGKIPILQLKHFYSILKAGDTIDETFLEDIEFSKFLNIQQFHTKGLLEFKSSLNTMKCEMKNQEVSFEHLILESAIVAVTKLNYIQNVQRLKDPSGEKIGYSVSSQYIQSAMKKVFKIIIEEIKEFAKHAEINIDETFVLGVGGVGGSKYFVQAAKDSLFSSQSIAEKRIVNIDANTAQNSISKGGVYLAEDKDHVNFDTQMTRIYSCDLDSVKVLEGVEMFWEIDVCKNFQMPQNCTHCRQKFFQIKELTGDRYFQCACDMFGARIKIYLKKYNFEQFIGFFFFPASEICIFDSEMQNNEVPQKLCYGCLDVAKKSENMITIQCRIIPNIDYPQVQLTRSFDVDYYLCERQINKYLIEQKSKMEKQMLCAILIVVFIIVKFMWTIIKIQRFIK